MLSTSKAFNLITYFIILSLVVSGCGGSGAGGGAGDTNRPVPTVLTVNGTAFKGPISGGSVAIYAINTDGTKGKDLGATTTDAAGAFSIKITGYFGPILAELTGGVYKDEATGNTVTNTATLRAAVTHSLNQQTFTVNITPLTEMAVQKAGVLSQENRDAANAAISKLIGTDIITTLPVDVSVPSSVVAATPAKAYGIMLAALSQLLTDHPATYTDLAVTIKKIGDDLSDGKLDITGRDLSNALASFIASPQNQSGVATISDTPVDDFIAAFFTTVEPPPPPLFTLAIQKEGVGIGTGTVISSSAGIDCGAVCAVSLVSKTPVTLTATTIASSVFVGWSGDCTGTSTCVVIMDADKQVTARFQGPIETGADLAYTPQVAVDSAGNAVVVWQQVDNNAWLNIWAARFDATTNRWGIPVRITDDTEDASDPQVVVDAAGYAIAVWQQYAGTKVSIWANRFVPGVGWGVPSTIETDDMEDAYEPQVAIDSAGNAIVVWHQNNGAESSIWVNRFEVGTRSAPGGWGVAEIIGSGTTPHVAVDSTGNGIAVWEQSDDIEDNISANRFIAGPGGGWGTATLIEMNTGQTADPRVAIDSTGNAIVVWHQNDGTATNVWVNRFEIGTGSVPGEWRTAEMIGTGTVPQVAIDSAGNAVAVWQQFDGTQTNIWANWFIVGLGGGWGVAELIETGTGQAADPKVGVDSSGNAIAIWQQYDGSQDNIWVNRFIAGIGGGWGVAALIELGMEDAIDPQMGIHSAGDALAVWTQGGNIWADWLK